MPKPYPKEFKEDVVRVAQQRDHEVTIAEIAKDLGDWGSSVTVSVTVGSGDGSSCPVALGSSGAQAVTTSIAPRPSAVVRVLSDTGSMRHVPSSGTSSPSSLDQPAEQRLEVGEPATFETPRPVGLPRRAPALRTKPGSQYHPIMR